MPAIKTRSRIIADNFITKSGQTREIFIPWDRFFVAASAVANLSASVAASQLGTCVHTLRYTGTSNTCVITLVDPIPQDAAISGPAAGSGTAYVYFGVGTGNGTVAKIGASLYAIPSGSAISDTTASALMAACVSVTAGSLGGIMAASLAQFNAPTTRSGTLGLKLVVNSIDNDNTAGSNFHLVGIGLRYKSDRIGS